jgi:transposase
MTKNFGRCKIGKRCYKTTHKYPFVKFNFICAIKYGKVIGFKLYKKSKGGIDFIKFNDFYNKYIRNKYHNHLIIMDNARFHKSQSVTENIKKSNNTIIFSLAYNPSLNPIENFLVN